MPMQEIREKSQPALAFPFWSAIIRHLGLVAQSVEQRIENPCVGGSIPPRATKNSLFKNANLRVGVFVCGLHLSAPSISSIALRSLLAPLQYPLTSKAPGLSRPKPQSKICLTRAHRPRSTPESQPPKPAQCEHFKIICFIARSMGHGKLSSV